MTTAFDNLSAQIEAMEDKKADAIFDKFARLLAKENIVIIQGNYRTAAFDVEARRLYLPFWKKMSRSIKLLFRIHEIGHALHTPKDGMHSFIKEKNGRAMASHLNIAEDCRIESKVKKEYPGLQDIMQAAYKELFESNFFGVSDIDEINERMFVDRLNIHSKVGNLYPILIKNQTEQSFLARSRILNTFEEAAKLAEDMFAYTKLELAEKKKEEQQKSQENGESGESDDSGEEDENQEFDEDVTQSSGSTGESNEEQKSDESGESDNSSTDDSSTDDTEQEKPSGKTDGDKSDDADTSQDSDSEEYEPSESEMTAQTAEASEKNEEKLKDLYADKNTNRYEEERTLRSTIILKSVLPPNKVIVTSNQFLDDMNEFLQ